MVIDFINLVFQSFLFWMLIRKSSCSAATMSLCRLFQSFLFWMLIRKFSSFSLGTNSWKVSILLILDVDSEVAMLLDSLKAKNPFQSFLFWMLIRKQITTSFPLAQVACFNPSYSGCWFGRDPRLIFEAEKSGFQSFLFWMLIRKLSRAIRCRCNRRVSILLILDVDSEAVKHLQTKPFRTGVSILLILDVDSEDSLV